eukprot:scaffold8405_cov32-Tisochrysis_lutea.AAC.1
MLALIIMLSSHIMLATPRTSISTHDLGPYSYPRQRGYEIIDSRHGAIKATHTSAQAQGGATTSSGDNRRPSSVTRLTSFPQLSGRTDMHELKEVVPMHHAMMDTVSRR